MTAQARCSLKIHCHLLVLANYSTQTVLKVVIVGEIEIEIITICEKVWSGNMLLNSRCALTAK